MTRRHDKPVPQNKLVQNFMQKNDLNAAPVPNVGEGTWSDAFGVAARAWAALGQLQTVLPLLKNRELIKYVDDPQSLLGSSQVLSTDAVEYRSRLEAIDAKRMAAQTPTGDVDTTDELMVAISVVEEYEAWLSSYNTVVLPNAQRILQLFENAVARYEQDQKPT